VILDNRASEVITVKVRVYLGGSDRFMPEHLLNRAEVGAALYKVRGE